MQRDRVSPSKNEPPPPPYTRLASPVVGNSNEEPPPLYSPLDASNRQSHSQISSQLQPVASSDQRVERLRRFLSFTLAIDYDLQDSTPDKLSAFDWSHFVLLAQTVARSCPTASRRCSSNLCYLNHCLRSTASAELRSQIVEPAAILGISSRMVILQLRLFVGSIRRGGKYGRGYASQLQQIAIDHGVKVLGNKLLSDRARLIEAVLPKHPRAMSPYRSLLTQMLVKNQTVIDEWFCELGRGRFVPYGMLSSVYERRSPWPLRDTFGRDAREAVGLLGLLKSDGVETAAMGFWRRRKYRASKKRERRLYVGSLRSERVR